MIHILNFVVLTILFSILNVSFKYNLYDLIFKISLMENYGMYLN